MAAGRDISRRDFVRAASIIIPAVALGGVGVAFGAREVYQDAIQETRTFVDDAGRSVEIPTPSHLSRVYFSGPIGQVMLFTLRPDLIAGTTLPFTRQELEYLPEGTSDLPFMGSVSENKEIDVEQLHEIGIQLILSVVGDKDNVEDLNLEDPDGLQEETGIPVVYLKAGFDTMADGYRKLGEIVGEQERAEELAAYLTGIYERVSEAVGNVPIEKRVKLYYAEGDEGLQTEPFNSAHAYTFGVAGAYNVADVENRVSHGMTQVSIEQVRKWDPEVIVAWDDEIRDGADELIRTSADWAGISAVENDRVYTMPNAPYSWCDRPAGPNRCIGIQWVANMLYPDYYDVDMVEVTKDFYRTMWRLDITDDQAKDLLGNSYPPQGS